MFSNPPYLEEREKWKVLKKSLSKTNVQRTRSERTSDLKKKEMVSEKLGNHIAATAAEHYDCNYGAFYL